MSLDNINRKNSGKVDGNNYTDTVSDVSSQELLLLILTELRKLNTHLTLVTDKHVEEEDII